MKYSSTFLAILLGCFLIACPIAGQDAKSKTQKTKQAAKKTKAKPLRALLIAGGCCHDYPNQIQIITQGISQRANVEWEVFHGLSPRERKVSLYQTDEWAKQFDIVVHNECYGAVNDVEFVERIVRGHTEHGIPMVAVHCSMHSYRNAKTEEWQKLLGVTSRRHEKGGVQLDVINRAEEHPIMKGFPANWRTPNGELYIIEKAWLNCTPLATAFGKTTKANYPVIWTNQYGKAKVFATTLGHHNETMLSDEWLDVVSRGLLWACNKLDEDGKPVEGYEGKGKRPIRLPGKAGIPRNAKAPTLADWSKSIKFPEPEKPIELFNGTDLSGWSGQAEYFSVKDGVIVARNSKQNAPPVSTYLTTKKKYRNFRLVFESKLVQSKMHSGISLWGETVKKDNEPFSYKGHLVMYPSGWGFYDLYRRNLILKDDGRAKAAGKQNDWNKMEILAIGSRIRFVVNGQEVADWTDPKPELCLNAPIGLQLHSNKVAQEVHFRGLRLSENPEDKLITVQE